MPRYFFDVKDGHRPLQLAGNPAGYTAFIGSLATALV
jgi:hypothetical protein